MVIWYFVMFHDCCRCCVLCCVRNRIDEIESQSDKNRAIFELFSFFRPILWSIGRQFTSPSKITSHSFQPTHWLHCHCCLQFCVRDAILRSFLAHKVIYKYSCCTVRKTKYVLCADGEREMKKSCIWEEEKYIQHKTLLVGQQTWDCTSLLHSCGWLQQPTRVHFSLSLSLSMLCCVWKMQWKWKCAIMRETKSAKLLRKNLFYGVLRLSLWRESAVEQLPIAGDCRSWFSGIILEMLNWIFKIPLSLWMFRYWI